MHSQKKGYPAIKFLYKNMAVQPSSSYTETWLSSHHFLLKPAQSPSSPGSVFLGFATMLCMPGANRCGGTPYCQVFLGSSASYLLPLLFHRRTQSSLHLPWPGHRAPSSAVASSWCLARKSATLNHGYPAIMFAVAIQPSLNLIIPCLRHLLQLSETFGLQSFSHQVAHCRGDGPWLLSFFTYRVFLSLSRLVLSLSRLQSKNATPLNWLSSHQVPTQKHGYPAIKLSLQTHGYPAIKLSLQTHGYPAIRLSTAEAWLSSHQTLNIGFSSRPKFAHITGTLPTP